LLPGRRDERARRESRIDRLEHECRGIVPCCERCLIGDFTSFGCSVAELCCERGKPAFVMQTLEEREGTGAHVDSWRQLPRGGGQPKTFLGRAHNRLYRKRS